MAVERREKKGEAYNINISGDYVADICNLLPIKKDIMNNCKIIVKKVEKDKFYGNINPATLSGGESNTVPS